MKLTKMIRDAFVSAAMQDVPWSKPYEALIEAKVREAFLAKLPPAIARAWTDNSLRAYVSVATFRGYGLSVTVPFHSSSSYVYKAELPDAAQHELDELARAWSAEQDTRRRLKDQLNTIAAGCTTRKSLVEQLPEFEKYLPTEASVSKSLPAVANVVADFVKAGWPASAPQTKETP